MEHKICTQCFVSKPLTDYHKNIQNKTGYRSECKMCHSLRVAKYNENKKKAKILGEVLEEIPEKPYMCRRHAIERKLNTESWKYPEQTEYEKQWMSEVQESSSFIK